MHRAAYEVGILRNQVEIQSRMLRASNKEKNNAKSY